MSDREYTNIIRFGKRYRAIQTGWIHHHLTDRLGHHPSRACSPFSGNLFVVSLVLMWPHAVYYLFQYNQRKDRSVCVRLTSQGHIEETGFTLDLFNRDRQRQESLRRLYIRLFLVLLGIIACLFLLILYQRAKIS